MLCSTAGRARETLEPITATLGEQVPVKIEPELYNASEHDLLARLRRVDDEVESVIVIGHNPGVGQLALSLAGSGEKLDSIARKYPTGALATLEFAGSWRQLEPGSADLTDFVTPIELATS